MTELINLHHNNSFVNRHRVPLLYENFGAIALAIPDFMADRLDDWLATGIY